MNQKDIQEFLLSLPNSMRGYPFGKKLAVYSTNNNSMFAILREDKKPLKISLRCDPQLAEVLINKYDEVVPAERLNQKQWISLILSGQLSADELRDLIRHSYDLSQKQD